MDAKKLTLKMSAIAVSIILASCGGGGSDGYYNSDNTTGTGGNENPGTTDAVVAELLSIGQSKSSLNAGTEDSLVLTIRTLDKSGGIIPKSNIKVEIVDAQNAGASLSTPTVLISDGQINCLE